MGVIVNKNEDTNDELSRRISADLRTKMYSSSDDDDYDDGSGLKRNQDPDFVEGSEYAKDFKKTSKFGWVWIVLIVLAILSIISIVML
ncbi:hypothetical protein IKW73_02010 [Candidatus Saccharibacteria bacterium]|nr:hypothetical protein [Candidatus Saccharibacteria bacterium]